MSLLPETSDDKAAHRIVRKIRDAANQMPHAARGMVVVDVGTATNLVAIQDAVRAAFANAPTTFDPIRAIAFHVGVPTPTGHHHRRVFGTPAPGARHDAAETKLLSALLLPRMKDGDTLEERRYGASGSMLVEFCRHVEPRTS